MAIQRNGQTWYEVTKDYTSRSEAVRKARQIAAVDDWAPTTTGRYRRAVTRVVRLRGCYVVVQRSLYS